MTEICFRATAEHSLFLVRIFRQLAAVFLLLFVSGAPVMACMLPGAQMTAEELACCRMMKGDCEHMQMSSGDCCKKVPQTSEMSVAQWKVPTFHPAVVISLCIAAWDLSPSAVLLTGSVAHPEASPPPESPPPTISILRV